MRDCSGGALLLRGSSLVLGEIIVLSGASTNCEMDCPPPLLAVEEELAQTDIKGDKITRQLT